MKTKILFAAIFAVCMCFISCNQNEPKEPNTTGTETNEGGTGQNESTYKYDTWVEIKRFNWTETTSYLLGLTYMNEWDSWSELFLANDDYFYNYYKPRKKEEYTCVITDTKTGLVNSWCVALDTKKVSLSEISGFLEERHEYNAKEGYYYDTLIEYQCESKIEITTKDDYYIVLYSYRNAK